ncbi:protein translocase subunit SecF [Candidatus Babeliales bacterium]|nr:protein translocase subunit SecF [Candidatus Babeliales bacterium]
MIDFLRYRLYCLTASIVFILLGVGVYFIKGGFKYHIDFVGGTEINILFEKPLNISELRAGLANKGWKDLTIQSVGFSTSGLYSEFVVKVGETDDGVSKRFEKDISSTIKNNKIEIRSVSRVGSEVGSDIRWRSFLSIILSLLVLLIYITVMRSGYRYALGAVAALVHDVLAVLVLFLVFEWQISVNVLAAILAILGYSLNDTIVIFSRIRENLKKLKGKPEKDIVNISLNQTLRRTLLTSLSTLLTVGSILVLGGEALRGFAIAMMIGVVFGTYSSIYISSPVMLAFDFSKD